MGKSKKPSFFSMTNLPTKFNLIILILLIVIIGWGCLLNFHGHKYSKIFPSDVSQLPRTFQHCEKKLVVALDIPNSYTCCDYSRSNDLLCVGTYDKATKIMSGNWAWIIPFTPLIVTTMIELLNAIFLPSSYNNSPKRDDTDSSYSMLSILQEDRKGKFLSIFVRSGIRAVAYLGIILFRAYLLYLLPFYVSEYLANNGTIGGSSQCWCPQFVSARKCQMLFDFSDHIVLCVVQYILPTLLEMNYLIANKFTISPGAYSTNGKSPVQLFSMRNIFFLPFLLQLFLIFLNFRTILFTTLFFHTPAETIAGFTLACLFSFSLLLSNDFVNTWTNLTR